MLSAKGTGPADTSPLCVLTGDHSYEVEVDIELGSGSTEGGLLLFFNNRLFCGMGIDGERMLSYSGGLRTHWREPAPPTRRMTLRIRNEEHIVTGWYRAPRRRVGAARRALRDLRLPREHDGRPPEPAPCALRRR